VFENRILTRIFGPKRNEVTGDWRNLHKKELHDLYSLRSIIKTIKTRKMRWVGLIERMGEKRNAYTLSVGKQVRKRPLGRPRCRWIDNKMYHLEKGCVAVDRIGLAQARDKWGALVNVVIKLRVP
jgi:hypothetical protein